MTSFPVINGSAIADGKSRAIAWVNPRGKIDLVSFKDKKNFLGSKIPFLRGIAFLIFGIYIFIASLGKSQLGTKTGNGEEFEEKIAKKLKVSPIVVTLTICGVTGALVGFFGLILIPYFFFSMLLDRGLDLYLVAFIMALLRVGLLILILLSLRFIPSMRQLYRNNAAGNLAVASHEGKRLDSHYLSTNFLNFVVWGFILSFFVVSFVVAEINFFFKFLINLAVTFAAFSLVYEFLKLFEFKNNLFAKIVINPVAYLTSEIPTQTERETAFSALSEVVLMEENEERIVGKVGSGVAFSVAYSEVKQRLLDAGISEPAEVDWLIASALNIGRGEVKMLTNLTSEQYKKIKNALAKREKRMPISKIFNLACFYGRDFYVDKNVLSPRQETELVAEEAIKEAKKLLNQPKVLDLMTGSGVVAVTVALETNSTVFASDVSKAALEVAKKNAKANGAKVKFVESDLFKAFKREKFDIIVSNPPYIASKEILTLDDEVKKYDPLISLDGGEDGLYFYREIANLSPKFLKEGGELILEIGSTQGGSVKKLLQNNFKNIKIKKDYSGNDRIVVATKK